MNEMLMAIALIATADTTLVKMAPPATYVDHETTVAIDGQTVDISNVVDTGNGHARCTLRIAGQNVPTYGHDDLEAYGCDEMVAAGLLARRSRRPRIALIYEVTGSPGVSFRTALVIERVGAKWRIEPGSPGLHDDSPEGRTLSRLRRWEWDRQRHRTDGGT